MNRDPDERMLGIQKMTRAACAALRAIFDAADLETEIERIGAAEEMLARLRDELDELERDSSPA